MAETATKARFTVHAHLGAGPWDWEVRDRQKVVALHVDRADANRTAKQLNEKGYVDGDN